MPSPKIRAVIGLGNPGSQYARTRHNVGYRLIERLESLKLSSLHLFIPDGFMNESGRTVAPFLRKKGVAPAEALVVCDDFAIPLGTLRIRLKGSSGGHNGLDSILQWCATQDVPRLRVGIGPVPEHQDPKDFVLKTFGKSEESVLDAVLDACVEAVKIAGEEGLETAMNRYNGLNLSTKESS